MSASTIVIDGKLRRLGNLIPPAGRVRYTWNQYGEDATKTPIIPRNQWDEINLERFLPPKYDQNGYGACNAYDTCTIIEACRAQAGLPYVRLSPGWLYGHINGQQDRGSLLEDAMQFCLTQGIAPESIIPEYHWQQSKWRGKDVEAQQEARKYRALEIWECRSFDEIASAFLCGFFVSLGIMWYGNYTPGSDGWLPLPRGRSGGHAIAGYGLAKKVVNGKTIWGARYRQSWGNSVPDGIIPESAFSGPVGGWWAIRSVVYPSAVNVAA